ncbi:MAG: hypothetical protein H6Q23_922, partial [Bacteroidetes bacterium]|nr:hypothetical protein [Bacteroidota bacterium]
MNARRDFLKKSTVAAVAAIAGPAFLNASASGN